MAKKQILSCDLRMKELEWLCDLLALEALVMRAKVSSEIKCRRLGAGMGGAIEESTSWICFTM